MCILGKKHKLDRNESIKMRRKKRGREQDRALSLGETACDSAVEARTLSA